MTEEVLAAVAEGRHHDPHSASAHPNPDGSVTIRTLRRFATSVAVRTLDGIFPLEHLVGGSSRVAPPTRRAASPTTGSRRELCGQGARAR
ncbi:hypothetical protein QJS66_09440 [Kocuria rhizophila]|nr:hypothetical protein QJS66_09440 [Kocuria rhizophila]